MNVVVRKLVKTEKYEGRKLEARHMGPDLLAFIDGLELPNFYIDVEAAFLAGRKYVDAEEAEKAKRNDPKNRRKK